MIPRDLPLPENCRVRLVDLPVQAGGVIAVDEDGFTNIYLNARLSREAQRRALQHELRHHYRGDLYSERDIRTVEREADADGEAATLHRVASVREDGHPALLAIDGTPVKGPVAAFDPQSLRRVGRGLYLPTGENLVRAAAHVDGVRLLLLEACQIYDVRQVPPLVQASALSAPAEALGPGDIAFVAWHPLGDRRTAVLHFSRENLYGAIYYADDGAPDNALAVLVAGDARVIVDVRRRNGRLEVCGIDREIGEKRERVY